MLAGDHVDFTMNGKEMATSSNRKRVWSGNVPPTTAVPKGKTRQFGVKVVTKEGKDWYKNIPRHLISQMRVSTLTVWHVSSLRS